MADPRQPKTKEEKNADVELEDLFADFSGTLTVKLERLEPEYAEGYCGKFNITAGRPLTAHEIKNRFGGKVFKMTARDSGGKYVKKKMISISGLPKDEGRVINPDGTLQPLGDSGQHNAGTQKKTGGVMEQWEALLNLPLPPAAKKELVPHILGIGGSSEKNDSSQSAVDMMNMQMMMKFQNDMRESQMRQDRMSMEMEKDMHEWRRAQADKPKDTLGGMNDMVKVFREMNGLKEEFAGSGTESVANTIISNTMPMIETMMAEFMKMKQLQVQLQLSQAALTPASAPPELPSRTPAAIGNSSTPVRVLDEYDESEETEDSEQPEEMAARMGQMFRHLSPERQQSVMNAFLNIDQNVESNLSDDTIENTDNEYLDKEDRELLENATSNQQNEDYQLQNSEHTRSVDDDHPNNREGDQGGGTVPADTPSFRADN